MKANTQSITVQTKVNSNLEKVWEYWTTLEHIINWNFASNEWNCTVGQNDLIVNGEFKYRMESKDAEMVFDFEGTYTNIIEEELIEYNLNDGRAVSVEFNQNEDSVIVTETFEPNNQKSIYLQRNGWQAILDNFKKYVESVI